MNNKLIALAVAGALSAPMAAQAGDVSISGFTDVFWTISDERYDAPSGSLSAGAGFTGNEVDGQFSVPETEVDFAGSGVRVDIDNVGSGGSMRFEQANFTFEVANGWSLTGGVFNNAMTDDAQDAPDMNFSTNSLLFSGGYVPSNLAGLALSGMAGPANVTVYYANDATASGSAGTDSKNSIGLVVGGSVMEGLNLEFGFLGQDSNTGSNSGDVMDINGMYTMNGLMVGLDYMVGDAQSTGLDSGYSFMAGYDFGNGFAVKGRLGHTEDAQATKVETDQTTLYVTYAINDNLSASLQNESIDNGTTDEAVTTVELLGTF